MVAPSEDSSTVVLLRWRWNVRTMTLAETGTGGSSDIAA